METGIVRKRVVESLTAVRTRAVERRTSNAEAERNFLTFLDVVATPLARQIVSALKAEGYAFTVFTPGRGLRIGLDKGRDDFIDLLLDTDGPSPQVMGHISYTRGSRTLVEERPVKDGVGPEALGEEEVLSFLLTALEPFLER